jgi:flagellar FliL protein
VAEEEAEEEQEEESAPAVVRPAQQPSLLRYLPIVLIVLLLQAGGAYFAIQEFLFPEEKTAVEDEEGRPRTIPDGEDLEDSVDLGEMLANPRGTRARLLVRANVTLGVAPSGVVGEIENEENTDRVRDAVLWELGNATYEELSTPEGRQIVKDKIKERINDFLYEGQVQKIFFEDFILQAMSGYGKKR